jgi:RNA polymerase sigma-70 factor (ECF subfamily)
MEKKELFELVEKATKGESGAFEALYSAYARTILFHASKLLDNRPDVEDVAQEIVLQMFKSIGKLKSPYAFYAWMYRIITNICYAHNTKHGPMKSEADIDSYADELEAKDKESIPEAALDRTELDNAIINAVNKLPDGQRLALYMYYYEQMSYKEIAAALNISTNTVGTNVMKAKKTLKSMIDRERIITNGDLDTLSGVAIAPALAHAFGNELNSIPSAQVESFISNCNKSIANLQEDSSGTEQKKTIRSGRFSPVTVVIVCAVAVTLFAAAILIFAGTQANAPASDPKGLPGAASSAAGEYKPDAKIELKSEGDMPSQINPYEATLVISDGEATEWRIADAGGDTVASGKGVAFSNELQGLQAGNYSIEWTVKNEKGEKALVVREIEIQ